MISRGIMEGGTGSVTMKKTSSPSMWKKDHLADRRRKEYRPSHCIKPLEICKHQNQTPP
jgi:hypothetical protein